MQGNRLLLTAVAGWLFCGVVFAQGNNLAQKVIYKWENDGLIYYSHIKPTAVQDFVKLDAEGRRVEDFTEEFDEIVEIAVVRPEKGAESEAEAQTPSEAAQREVEEELAKKSAQEVKNKNCETARKNMSTLDGGEVYERDSQGNMIRLSAEQIDSKRKNVQRDVDYFCEER